MRCPGRNRSRLPVQDRRLPPSSMQSISDRWACYRSRLSITARQEARWRGRGARKYGESWLFPCSAANALACTAGGSGSLMCGTFQTSAQAMRERTQAPGPLGAGRCRGAADQKSSMHALSSSPHPTGASAAQSAHSVVGDWTPAQIQIEVLQADWHAPVHRQSDRVFQSVSDSGAAQQGETGGDTLNKPVTTVLQREHGDWAGPVNTPEPPATVPPPAPEGVHSGSASAASVTS
jgi:hypothetical protein